MSANQSNAAHSVPTGTNGNTPFLNPKLRLGILGVLLLATGGMFAKQVFDKYYIPAYGDDPQALADIAAADPRALSADDLTTLRNDDGAFAEEVANLDWQSQPFV